MKPPIVEAYSRRRNIRKSDESTGLNSKTMFPRLRLLRSRESTAREMVTNGRTYSFKVPVATMLTKIAIVLTETPVTVERVIRE